MASSHHDARRSGRNGWDAGAGRPRRVPQRYSRLALLVVVTGVLIAAADTTIVVLALPEIKRSPHIGLASPEDFKIEVEDDILTVSGAHEERKEKKDAHYLRRERR